MLQLGSRDLWYEHLVLLGSKLQFFACGEFIVGNSMPIAPSLLDQFPNLQGFMSANGNAHPESWGQINSLTRALLQLSRPVCRIQNDQTLDEETVKLLAKGGTKCLLMNPWHVPPRFSLSQSLAESLIELRINFVPTAQFCPFTLPNLLYLTVTPWLQAYSTAFVSAPNLQRLTLDDTSGMNLSELMSLIHSFNQLRVLFINMYRIYSDPPQENAKLSLPTSLEKLTITNKGIHYCSTSLKYLVVKREASTDILLLDEGLHRTVHDLMRRRVLTNFVHPAKCTCQADCPIKGRCLP